MNSMWMAPTTVHSIGDRAGEQHRHEVEDGGDPEEAGNSGSLAPPGKRGRTPSPCVPSSSCPGSRFVEDLDVAADALDAGVQGEHGLERRGENEKGQERRDGKGASAAVADRQAGPDARPATNIQTRAVPRSRIVARSARYSSSSRGVMGVASYRAISR